MKRDQIERLKHNTRLDVRMPDQLKDEFLERCREEGVSSGAVIRSLIVDYLKTRPRPVLARLDQLKEMTMKRSKWITGGLGGGLVAMLAVTGIVITPSANADDVEVAFTLQVAEQSQSSNFYGDYSIALGEPMMLFLEDDPLEGQYGFIIKVNDCAEVESDQSISISDSAACELIWEIEIFEALDWQVNEMGGVSVTDKRIVATPQLSALRTGSVAFQVGSTKEDGTRAELISGNLLLRSQTAG